MIRFIEMAQEIRLDLDAWYFYPDARSRRAALYAWFSEVCDV